MDTPITTTLLLLIVGGATITCIVAVCAFAFWLVGRAQTDGRQLASGQSALLTEIAASLSQQTAQLTTVSALLSGMLSQLRLDNPARITRAQRLELRRFLEECTALFPRELRDRLVEDLPPRVVAGILRAPELPREDFNNLLSGVLNSRRAQDFDVFLDNIAECLDGTQSADEFTTLRRRNGWQ